jgi:hypothetical protein
MRSSCRDVGGVLVLVGIFAVAVGCSGGSSTPTDGAAGSGMAGQGVLGGRSGSGGKGGSGAGGTSDGGADVAPESHMVQCGQTADGGAIITCDNRTQVCCRNSRNDTAAQADGGAGWAFGCAAIGTCAKDVSQGCNSAANCPAPQICATVTSWQADAGVQQVYGCMPPATAALDESGDPYPNAALISQLCASNAECPSSLCQLEALSSDPLGYLGACLVGSGHVLCGGSDCPSAAPTCCFNSALSTPYFCAISFTGDPITSCVAPSTSTFTVTSSSSIYDCDSAADCGPGSFCCQQPFTGVSFSGSYFVCGTATTCSNQAERLCGHDAECGSGYHCAADPQSQGPGHCRAN